MDINWRGLFSFFLSIFLLTPFTAKGDERLLEEQVKIDKQWFMFGSEGHYDDQYAEARARAEEENFRIRQMEGQVGKDTFELIQQGLQQHGRKAMEEHHPRTRDGGAEPDAVYVRSFLIDKTAVTIKQFRRFVKLTSHKTDAEKYGWSFVLRRHVSSATEAEVEGPNGLGHVKETPWWLGVLGAYWKRPEGKDSTIKGRENEPVTHVSWNDAAAYCKWAGRRLPSEEEWELAARGGLEDMPLPWGKALDDTLCNGWQGDFPDENSVIDGFDGVAPVNAFDPNGYGLYQMVGNVWEWTGGSGDKRPMRGGSFVDTLNGRHNHALRVSTRMDNTPDSSSSNTGFRCAKSNKIRKDEL